MERRQTNQGRPMGRELEQLAHECIEVARSMPRVTGLFLGIAAQPLVEVLWKAFHRFMTN